MSKQKHGGHHHSHHKGSNEDKFWGMVYSTSIIALLLLPCLALWLWFKTTLGLS